MGLNANLLTSHFSFLIPNSSHFSLIPPLFTLIYYLFTSSFTSHFSLLTSHLFLLSSPLSFISYPLPFHFSLLTPHSSPCLSPLHFSLLTSHSSLIPPLFTLIFYLLSYLHNSRIKLACWGNNSTSSSALANSKSSKSKPGATVQPTSEKVDSNAGLDANQAPAGTVA